MLYLKCFVVDYISMKHSDKCTEEVLPSIEILADDHYLKNEAISSKLRYGREVVVRSVKEVACLRREPAPAKKKKNPLWGKTAETE